MLARIGLRPEDCFAAAAWWGIDDDATLLEAGTAGPIFGGPRLFAKAAPHEQRRVYLVAVFDAPFLTRTLFEAVMVRFTEARFPRA